MSPLSHLLHLVAAVCLFVLPPASGAPIPRHLKQPNIESRADAGGKLVFAHFMVGNTFPYTLKDWSDDIALAQANGIDGFALNVGGESFHRNRVKDAYVCDPSPNISRLVSFTGMRRPELRTVGLSCSCLSMLRKPLAQSFSFSFLK